MKQTAAKPEATKPQPYRSPERRAPEQKRESRPLVRTIPFEIVKENAFQDIKVSYDVRVDLVDGRLPTKDELAAISSRLRSPNHKATYVSFYLPGMEIDAGAFATGHHTPKLEVRILSAAIPEEYRRLVSEKSPASEQPKPFATTEASPSDEGVPTSQPEREYRTWTSANGKYTTEAIFVSFADGTVKLEKRDGKTATLPLDKLSKADRDFIAQISAEDVDEFDQPTFGVYVADVASVYDALKEQDIRPPTRIGVMVTHVIPNSPADLAKITESDIILRIQRNTLNTSQEFTDAVLALEIGKEYIVAVISASERRGRTRWTRGNKKLAPMARRDVLLNAMTKKLDDVRGIVFWRHPKSPEFLNTKSEMYCYIAAPTNSAPSLRLKIQYVATDWLFVRRIIVKVDDKSFTLDTSGLADVERDNGGGKIWEWHDRAVGPDERKMLESFLNGKSVTLRFQGDQYYKDIEMPADEIRRLQTVMSVYDILSKR